MCISDYFKKELRNQNKILTDGNIRTLSGNDLFSRNANPESDFKNNNNNNSPDGSNDTVNNKDLLEIYKMQPIEAPTNIITCDVI